MKRRSVTPLLKTKNRSSSQSHRKSVRVPPPCPFVDVIQGPVYQLHTHIQHVRKCKCQFTFNINSKLVLFASRKQLCNPSTKVKVQTEEAAFGCMFLFLLPDIAQFSLVPWPGSPASHHLYYQGWAVRLSTRSCPRSVSQLSQTGCYSGDRRLNLAVHHHHHCGGLTFTCTSPFHTSHRARLTHPHLCALLEEFLVLPLYLVILHCFRGCFVVPSCGLLISAILYVLLRTLSHHMDSHLFDHGEIYRTGLPIISS